MNINRTNALILFSTKPADGVRLSTRKLARTDLQIDSHDAGADPVDVAFWLVLEKLLVILVPRHRVQYIRLQIVTARPANNFDFTIKSKINLKKKMNHRTNHQIAFSVGQKYVFTKNTKRRQLV